MSEIFFRDAWEFMAEKPDGWCDVIIADPPYDENFTKLEMDEFRRICKGHIIMFCDPRRRFFIPDEVAIWKKPESSKNNSKHLSCFFEEILIERHGNTYNHDLTSANYTGIYYDILAEKPKHPYQKPLSLMERLVKIYSNPSELIFDPFAGSGTTITAAMNCGRRAVGCEIDKRWMKG